jgi:hypothetical protein
LVGGHLSAWFGTAFIMRRGWEIIGKIWAEKIAGEQRLVKTRVEVRDFFMPPDEVPALGKMRGRWGTKIMDGVCRHAHVSECRI